MSLVVAQLSDFHIKTSTDSVLAKAAEVAAAIASASPKPSAVLLLLAGDITFSGADYEYSLASKFFDQILEELGSRLPTIDIHVVAIPGNHDCDFKSPMESRTIVSENLRPRIDSIDQSSDISQLMTLVQSEFFKFRRRLTGVPEEESLLFWQATINVGPSTVRVDCYNTAWMSALRERPGALLFPVKAAELAVGRSPDASLVLAVLHHPLNWFEPTNGRLLREHLERSADIVLTGHEHFDHAFEVIEASGPVLGHLQAGPMQAEGLKSQFRVVLVALDERKQRVLSYEWNDSLYRQTSQGEWQELRRNPSLEAKGFSFSAEFSDYLDDCGVPFTHPRKRDLRLSDIFVWPEFSHAVWADRPGRQNTKTLRAEDVFAALPSLQVAQFSGEANSGKTCLAKVLTTRLRTEWGRVPVLLDGRAISGVGEEALTRSVETAFTRQYSAKQIDNFRQLEPAQRVVVVDDFHLAPLNRHGREQLQLHLCRFASLVIVLTDDLYGIGDISAMSGATGLETAKFSIKALGWRHRGELIRRWEQLGNEHVLESDDLAHRVDQHERLVATLLGKDLLPSHPVTVLTILQTQDVTGTRTPSGSLGYLYEHLITNAFSEISSRSVDIDAKYSFVSHIANEMFERRQKSLTNDQFVEASRDFIKQKHVDVDVTKELAALVTVRMLESRSGEISFKYPYLYCYFVARYLRDNAEKSKVGATLERLVERVHVEEYANVLMFYVYLTRDMKLVNSLLALAKKIFGGHQEFSMTSEFVERLFKESRPVVLNTLDTPEKQREAARAKRDEEDEYSRERDNQLVEETAYDDALPDALRLNFAFKALELLGQVVRNFPVSLDGQQKQEITAECYRLGLRTLGAFMAQAEEQFDTFRALFVKFWKDVRPNDSVAQLSQHADEALIALTSAVNMAVVRRIATAVGLEELKRTYADVLASLGHSVPARMVDIQVKLDHFRHPPIQELERLSKDLRKNYFASQLLREIVAFYLYIYRTENQSVRQKLGAMFGIQVNQVTYLANPDKRN